MASDAVAKGLRTRMAYLEAAGWLRHARVWIHPRDLALRDNALIGTYAAAAVSNRLDRELPGIAKVEPEWAAPPPASGELTKQIGFAPPDAGDSMHPG